MDPIGSIVEALVTGAATGATTVGGKMITGSYNAFRKRLRRRLGRQSDTEVEKFLEDPAEGRPALERRLLDAGADADPRLMDLARRVLAEAGSTIVNAPNSMGVQVGSRNVQENVFGAKPSWLKGRRSR